MDVVGNCTGGGVGVCVVPACDQGQRGKISGECGGGRSAAGSSGLGFAGVSRSLWETGRAWPCPASDRVWRRAAQVAGFGEENCGGGGGFAPCFYGTGTWVPGSGAV